MTWRSMTLQPPRALLRFSAACWLAGLAAACLYLVLPAGEAVEPLPAQQQPRSELSSLATEGRHLALPRLGSSATFLSLAAPSAKDGAQHGSARASGERTFEVFPQAMWRSMPGVELADLTTWERISRAPPPAGVQVVNDPVAWSAAAGPDRGDGGGSSAFDAPPPSLPAFSTEHFVVNGGCFYSAPGLPSVIYTRQGSQLRVLCAHESADWCAGAARTLSARAPDAFDGRPVLHLSYGALFQGGYYHALVQLLPYVEPHLPALRSGQMRLLIEYDLELLRPVLERLGIADSSFGPPPPSAADREREPFGFCAPAIHLRRHSGYANQHPDAGLLRRFRAELRLPEATREKALPAAGATLDVAQRLPAQGPADAEERGRILLLSRGNGTRSISNERELVAGLESRLNRGVDVLHPGAADLDTLVAALQTAEAVVGVHGANLANILFAPAGTKVLEIVPQTPFRMENHHYWTLSGALGFPYRPVGQALPAVAEDGFLNPMRQHEAIRSFEVGVERVAEALAQLLLASAGDGSVSQGS